MAKKTIQNKWAQNSSNVQTFTEAEVAAGIEYKGAVVSNQLNGVAADLYEYADNLQRAGTAWNPLKSYEIGDVVEVRAVLNGEQSIAKFACIEAGKSAPLVDNEADSFTLDDSKNVCVFTITDDGTKTLKAYCGTSWITLKEPVFVEAKKEIFLEVKDYVISTAFVGLNYEVDLEAIVEANSTYKKGQFKIKSCQFVPHLTAGSAGAASSYGNSYLSTASSLAFSASTKSTNYNHASQYLSLSGVTSGSAYGAYSAIISASTVVGNSGTSCNCITKASYWSLCEISISSGRTQAYSKAFAAYWARAQTKCGEYLTLISQVKIIYEVWNSDKTIIIDRLTTGAMLFINENQKLLIQNEEQNCQSRTMGGTFYFKLEV